MYLCGRKVFIPLLFENDGAAACRSLATISACDSSVWGSLLGTGDGCWYRIAGDGLGDLDGSLSLLLIGDVCLAVLLLVLVGCGGDGVGGSTGVDVHSSSSELLLSHSVVRERDLRDRLSSLASNLFVTRWNSLLIFCRETCDVGEVVRFGREILSAVLVKSGDESGSMGPGKVG